MKTKVIETLPWKALQHICGTHRSFADAQFWFSHLLSCATDWPTEHELNQVARKISPDFRWQFIESPKVPRRAKAKGMTSLSGYVESICRQNLIPIRMKNLHDFLNAASFLIFPKSKLALNERHLMESPLGLQPGQNRTRTQDLLTMFDEGGVLRLTYRDDFRDLIFGHAVYEHIVLDKKLRAARLDIPVYDGFLSKSPKNLAAHADQWFADWLVDPGHCLKSDEFSHVWIPEN